MDEVKKLELKIQALRETHSRRIEQLDDLVADLRVSLTETTEQLKATIEELSRAQAELAQVRENETDDSKEEDLSHED